MTPTADGRTALRRRVARWLAFLIAVDLVLCLVGLAWPELWFEVIHGTAAIDPQRLLQRTAAAWAAFLALQVIAYARFRRDPAWLAVIAGVRLADVPTDWTHLILAPDLTRTGTLCLLAASPINLCAGLVLLRAHRRLTAGLR